MAQPGAETHFFDPSQYPGMPSVWKKIAAFAGPGFRSPWAPWTGTLDPTDLGRVPCYTSLLSVIPDFQPDGHPAAPFASRWGSSTGRDLAQACRDHYPKPVVAILWLLRSRHCRLSVTGRSGRVRRDRAPTAFGIPLVWGCPITALDVMIVLFLQNRVSRSCRGARHRAHP